MSMFDSSLSCSTRQPVLRDDEVVEMLSHLLLRPECLKRIREHLGPELFPTREAGYFTVLQLAAGLVERHGEQIMRPKENWLDLLEREARAVIPEDEQQFRQVFGDPPPDTETGAETLPEENGDDLDGEYEKSEETDKAIAAYFADDGLPPEEDTEAGPVVEMGLFGYLWQTDPATLVDSRGQELIRRFLEERFVGRRLQQEFTSATHSPANLQQTLADATQSLRSIDNLFLPSPGPLEDSWDAFLAREEQFRGRELVGLRTGIHQLDTNTMGLRGLTLLSAGPNSGKTALALDCSVGVLRHHEENNAAVLVCSLEMYREEMCSRIVCNTCEIDWAVWKRGSTTRPTRPGQWFTPSDQARIDRGFQRLDEWQVRQRMMILDQATMPGGFSVDNLVATGQQLKQRTRARRLLYVIDYLQRLPVPAQIEKMGEITADRYRVATLQALRSQGHTADGTSEDVVLCICESRKPSSATQGWGKELSEVMGSARIAYAADAVLTCQPMTEKEFNGRNPVGPPFEELPEHGVSPVLLRILKGRDGMERGKWPMFFHFRQYRFTPFDFSTIPLRAPCSPGLPRPHADGASTAAASVPEDVLARACQT